MTRKARHRLPASAFVFIPHPSGWAEERRSKRIRARDCLRRSRVRARPRVDRAPQLELLGSDANFAAVLCTAPAGRAIGPAHLDSDPNNSPIYARCFASQKGQARGAKCSRAGTRQGFATLRMAFLAVTRRERAANNATRHCLDWRCSHHVRTCINSVNRP